jgi:hypothetical protein
MQRSLSPSLKLGGFAVALLVVLAASFGVARAVAPGTATSGGSSGGHGAMDMGDPSGAAPASLPGLAVASAGYRFVPEATNLALGPAQPFRFRLLGPDGAPVQRYEQLHERELHLIVVRRDMTGFQHLHPVRAPDGTWAVPLDLPTGGTWRAFADFQPAGGPGQLTLGVDLQVTGSFQAGTAPAAVAPPDPHVTAAFDRRGNEVEIVVRRDGVPIEPEPYLGARGHLVALRAGDLAYLHVHPETGSGPGVRFNAALPTPGTYALFFDHQVDGVVRTATTTVEAR